MTDEIDVPAATRRDMLKYLAAAAGLGGIASQVAVDPFAHPVAALNAQEDAFTTEERRIESHDGIELDTTIYMPNAEGPHPAVLMTHGWGGDKRQLQPLASVYASNEYVVLAYTSRGFGKTEDSEGSGGQVNSTSELERKDASALIDYLAGLDMVVNDGENNPRIGMDGVSYGGGIQLRTAANDDRLNAIVPRATWHNLAQSLAINGVVKTGWLRALELGANQASPTGDVAPAVNEKSSQILERGAMSEADIEFYRSRSPVTYGEIDTPALLIPEWTDQLFPVNQGVNNFRKVQQSGADTTLIAGQDGTHILGQGENYPPGSGLSRQFVGQQALTWMNAHLKGDGNHGLSTYHYFDGDAAADAESPGEAFMAADQFPPYERQSLSYTMEETVELTGGDRNVATIDREVSEETELNGIPTLTVEATPTGEGPSHLFVAIQRVRDGEAETLKQQVTPYRLGSEGTTEFDLSGIQGRLQSGDTLRIAMSASAKPLTNAEPSAVFGGNLYLNTPEGSGIEISEGTEVSMSVPASAALPAAQMDDGDMDDDDGSDDGSGDDSDDGSDDGSDDSSGDMDESESDDGGSDDGGSGDDGGSSDDGGPGFGIPAALGGAGGLGYLLKKRLGNESAPTPEQEQFEGGN